MTSATMNFQVKFLLSDNRSKFSSLVPVEYISLPSAMISFVFVVLTSGVENERGSIERSAPLSTRNCPPGLAAIFIWFTPASAVGTPEFGSFPGYKACTLVHTCMPLA